MVILIPLWIAVVGFVVWTIVAAFDDIFDAMMPGFFSLLVLGAAVGVTAWWMSAGVSARLYNAKFDTSFTRDEMFWAPSAVNATIIKMGKRDELKVEVEGLK